MNPKPKTPSQGPKPELLLLRFAFFINKSGQTQAQMPGSIKAPHTPLNFCGALAKPKQNFYSFVYAPTTARTTCRAFKSASVRFGYELRQMGQRHYIYIYKCIYISPFTIRWTSKCLWLILELIFPFESKNIFPFSCAHGVAKNINVAYPFAT